MSFDSKNLSRNGSGQGNSQAVWTYHTLDDFSTVTAPGYFDEAQSRMQRGDLIYVWDDNALVQTLAYVFVSSPSGGVIVSAGLTIPA